jgi:hypothetical protein
LRKRVTAAVVICSKFEDKIVHETGVKWQGLKRRVNMIGDYDAFD